MARRPLDLNLTPEMVAGYGAGTLSSYKIAAALGCSQPTALKRLRAAGVDVSANAGGARAPRLVIPPEMIRAYRRRKVSVDDIAAALDCSHGGVIKSLRRAGVDTGRNGRKSIDPAGGPQAAGRHLGRLLRWLRDAGMTDVTIASALGITAVGVAYLRKRYA